jgi:hypothetical protein
MVVLDTNVLSALMHGDPSHVVAQWLDTLSPASIWTNAITVYEVRFGLETMPEGRRRRALERSFVDAMRSSVENRILLFDETAAEAAVSIALRQRRAGRPVEIRDVQIAGIVASRRAMLATGNTRHFEGVGLSLINPWNQ